MHNINEQLFFIINNLAGKYSWLDSFFVFVTDIGFKFLILFVLAYFFIIVPLGKKDPKERMRAWWQALLIAISVVITWAIVWYIKVLFMSGRPFEVLTGVQQLIQESSKTSFPSNHAAVSMSLATAVYLHHKSLGIALFISATIVIISRIFVGVHFPGDVIVGACIGTIISLGVIKAFRPYKI